MTYAADINPVLLQPALYYNQSCIFGFECDFEEMSAKDFLLKNYYLCFVTSGVYLVIIFGLKAVMESRKAFDLRFILFLWNLGLSIFSVIGAARFLPEIIHVVTEMGFYYSTCCPTYTANKVSGFWGFMFVLSKVVELFDTVFIVLRKKNLIFLHWYHHITVLMYTWTGALCSLGPARYYVGINYLVHAMMYPYYTLSAFGFRLPKAMSIFITTSQILQMFLAIYITVYAAVTRFRGIPCHFPDNFIIFGLLMYLSYLVLFGNFFHKNYLASRKTDRKRK